jgi:protein involved in polysaccharide export with SLBB domain
MMTRRLSVVLVVILLFFALEARIALAGGRILTTSDVVAIRIVDHPDLDMNARIEPDGTINFPYVGRIQAAGCTEDALGQAVESRLIEMRIIAGPSARGVTNRGGRSVSSGRSDCDNHIWAQR